MTRDIEDDLSDPQYLEENLTEQERQLDELDSFFSGMDPGVVLMVYRLQPTWCKGALEEIHVGNATSEINLGYFIENWGGQLLQIKVRGHRGRWTKGYLIPLYSYPPLVNKRRITKDDLENPAPSPRQEKPEVPHQQNPVIVNSNQGFERLIGALPAIVPMISEYMRNQELRRQSDMTMMAQLFQAQNRGGGIRDITQIGAVMKQLHEMFPQGGGGGDMGGDMDFMSRALDVVKAVVDKPKQQTATHHSLTGPQAPKLAGPPSPASSANKVTPLKPSADIATSLSTMNPQAAAETIIEAIGRMPPGAREEAMGHFLSEFQEYDEEEEEEVNGSRK